MASPIRFGGWACWRRDWPQRTSDPQGRANQKRPTPGTKCYRRFSPCPELLKADFKMVGENCTVTVVVPVDTLTKLITRQS